MKKRFFAIGACALLAFSCSSDDDSLDYSKLTRKWYNVSEKVGGTTFPYDDHETCGKDYVEFMDSNMGRFVDVWGCDSGPQTDESEFAWTREGNTLIVGSDGFTDEVTIRKLNSSTLELSTVYDYDDDGEDDTVILVYSSTP